MSLDNRSTTGQRIRHALKPSFFSVATGLALALALVIGHVIYISLHTGTIWLSYQDGYVATYYTNYVVQPLLNLSSLPVAQQAKNVVFWAVIGGGLYALGEYLFAIFWRWYKDQTQAQVVNRLLVKHPRQQDWLVKLVWRFGLGVVIFVWLWAMLPLIRYAQQLDYKIVNDRTIATTVGHFLLAVLIWLVVINVWVILIRLYSFRVRIFGGNLGD